MRIRIKSTISDWDFEKETEYFQNLKNEIFDSIQDELWDLYSDILSCCPIVPQGSFVESEIYDRVCKHAKEYIISNQSRWTVECTEFDEDGNMGLTTPINITELLLAMLDDDSSTGEFDARLSGYVENCLFEFVKNSTWHIENNCLWFGIDKPLSTWLINSETDLAFWFEVDSWTIMSCLGDFSDCFLIWYTAECGCWTPDMSDISNSCPVQFVETDTIESILEKAATWYSENNN